MDNTVYFAFVVRQIINFKKQASIVSDIEESHFFHHFQASINFRDIFDVIFIVNFTWIIETFFFIAIFELPL